MKLIYKLMDTKNNDNKLDRNELIIIKREYTQSIHKEKAGEFLLED